MVDSGHVGSRRLDLHFTNLEESGLHFLIFYYLGLVAFATGEELKKRHSSLQIRSSDTEMLNVCGFHININFIVIIVICTNTLQSYKNILTCANFFVPLHPNFEF